MAKFQIGKAAFELTSATSSYLGTPAGQSTEATGEITTYRATTTDQLNLLFGIVVWQGFAPEVIPVEFLDGEGKYERLANAGRISVIEVGFSWIVELNAMKFNPDNNRVNLASSSQEALSYFAGSSIETVFSEFGTYEIGSRESLHGETNRNRSRLAIKMDAGNTNLLAAVYLVTRVLAIMHDYGMDDHA